MKFSPLPISDRITALKESYKKLPVPQEINPYVDKKYKKFRSGDRWITLGYLRGWYNHANSETTLLRTSYSEAEELYEAQPLILDDELLLGHVWFPELSSEEQLEYERLADMFVMSSHTLEQRPPRKDHIALDFDKLLRCGINGVKAEIEKKISELNLNDPNFYPDYADIRKYEFYKCLTIELDAVLDLARRYSAAAEELAATKSEPRRSELLRLADIIKRVPANPAESFWEAIQSVHFLLSGLFGLFPLARPDRYLYRFYEKDVQSGNITPEFAQELIDNFCLGVSDRVFTRSACGFIVGGLDASGEVVENELTYMFLNSLSHLKLPDPNGALAVSRKTSDDILRYSAEILSEGTTHPAFYNDDVIISSLVKYYGVNPKDAVNYVHATCAEMSVAGCSKSHTTPICIDLPALLLDFVSKNRDISSAHELIGGLVEGVSLKLREEMMVYAIRMLEAERIGNDAMRICAFIDDCIERGRSIYSGGERYTFISPIFVGFATALDSINAIKELVFDKKKISLDEFCRVVENNFENDEPLRQYIINKVAHYGNDSSEIDAMAAELAQGLVRATRSDDVLGGKIMCPGTFSYINHATMGERTGATFDGRLRGTSYSDGCCPVQGRDTKGPTAMILSLTSFDESELLGGMVVNMKFAKNNLSGERADSFVSILRTFMERGGIEMQVNVVDKATLIEAKREPEKHSDLIVRIGGFSDYFVRLRPSLQDEIIERTEY